MNARLAVIILVLSSLAAAAQARPMAAGAGPVHDWTDALGHEHHTHRKPTPSMMAGQRSTGRGDRLIKAPAPRMAAPAIGMPRQPRVRLPRPRSYVGHTAKRHTLRLPRLGHRG